jgi:hypothetical protein
MKKPTSVRMIQLQTYKGSSERVKIAGCQRSAGKIRGLDVIAPPGYVSDGRIWTTGATSK